MKKWIVLFFFVKSISVYAAMPSFDLFCSQLLQKDPKISDYSTYFTEDFRKQIPLSYLQSVFSELHNDVGPCISYSTTLTAPNKFKLTLNGEKKIDATLSVTVDESQGLFNGLLLNGIQDPNVQIKNWSDVGAALTKLDSTGKLSATLTTADGSIEFLHNSSDVFAIGSTFKLYVLGALEQAIAKGLHQWDEILPLKEEWKSLPSGIMHTWPEGQKVTLYEYAEKMISISDNTATDHLLYLLGREKVEQMLLPMGNNHQNLYLPFLGTLEMFKLKWAIPQVEAQNYISKNRSERLLALDDLKKIPKEQVGTNGAQDKPIFIDQIEWFATTKENCKAMFWLASRNNLQLRSILSKNVPLLTEVGSPESHWAFAGFKGGSEPGVLNMTFLIESKRGQRACLSMSWNNKNKSVSSNRLIDILKKTLDFAESIVP